MAESLTIYLPDHGYSDDDHIYISWLDANYYVADKDADSFKLVTASGGSTYIEFDTTVTDGFVREVAGAGTTTISGLDHLEGEAVKVTSGGEVISTEVVSDGEITVSSTVFTYQVGLPYNMKIRTMRLSVPQEAGTLQTRIKRITEIVLRYIRSKLDKAGVEYSGTEYLTDYDTEFSTSSQDAVKPAKGGFNEDAYTVITSTEPTPFTLLSTIVTFEVEERK